ncbi:MAG: phosphopentomutase, partial [Erysipelotrichaceae bacterium]|nr:phosphopentomutase [Erysipelotrichaceae bacterium]
MTYKRIFTIVIDSVGAGSSYDSDKYDDDKADTLGNIAKATQGLHLPNMEKLGLGNLHDIQGVKRVDNPLGYYTKMQEMSLGKDTMTGHWEMMGLYIDEPFITFTDTGFPDELITMLEEKTGYKVIGNKAASGTEILDELGERHMQTKEMIVYTSADSVLQIAAHEEVFGLEE